MTEHRQDEYSFPTNPDGTAKEWAVYTTGMDEYNFYNHLEEAVWDANSKNYASMLISEYDYAPETTALVIKAADIPQFETENEKQWHDRGNRHPMLTLGYKFQPEDSVLVQKP